MGKARTKGAMTLAADPGMGAASRLTLARVLHWAVLGVAPLLLLALAMGMLVAWVMHADLPIRHPTLWALGTVACALIAVALMGLALWRLRRRGWLLALVVPSVGLGVVLALGMTVMALVYWNALIGDYLAPAPWISTDDAILRIHGPISPVTVAGVRQQLNEHSVTQVVITSPGGLAGSMRALSRTFEQQRIEVLAAGECFSACAILWSLASRRAAMAETRFMFHAAMPAQGPIRALEIHWGLDQSNASFYSALVAAGIPPQYLHTVRDNVPGDIYVTAETLQAQGVRFRWLAAPEPP
jgi:hypothetical protein